MAASRPIALTFVLLLFAIGEADAAGFQVRSAPDPDDRPLRIAISYPSDAPASRQEGFAEPVALNGAVKGERLPLVVISHGNGGSYTGHSDTASALAEAGFVVAAVMHTGDNFQDQSYAGSLRWFGDRPRHVRRTIDYMLAEWPDRSRIDPQRIGFFGFSMGGFTGLIAIGATPDVNRIRAFCAQYDSDFVCGLLRQLRSEILEGPARESLAWVHEPRIRAAVLAAPGFPYLFSREALGAVHIPLQIWTAEHDDRVPGSNVSGLIEAFPVRPEHHTVANAGHFAFLPPCSFSAELCTDPPGFDRAAFHTELNKSVVVFFRQTLDER